jgi:hypothetical protein
MKWNVWRSRRKGKNERITVLIGNCITAFVLHYFVMFIGSMSVEPRARPTPANTGLCLFNEHSHYVIFKNYHFRSLNNRLQRAFIDICIDLQTVNI